MFRAPQEATKRRRRGAAALTPWSLPARLNRAAGCADIWAKGDPVPVHADGDNAIRNLMLAWSSVDKNGEPSTASNTVSVTGNREIGSDGVIYASKNASLTMVFNTAPNYILQLLTLKDGGGAELLADSNLTSMPFALGAPAVTATALFAAKDPALTPPFTVGFDLGGAPGPVPDAQSVDGYGKAVEPTPPVWADYLFLGWYTPDGSKWHFAGAVMRPMTLTARWHDGFRVIFDYNYDVGPAPDTQLVRTERLSRSPRIPRAPYSMRATMMRCGINSRAGLPRRQAATSGTSARSLPRAIHVLFPPTRFLS